MDFLRPLSQQVDALSRWGNIPRAEQLMSYWLNCFIRRDGSIMFQGPSLSEYGQLLTTLRNLVDRSGNREWLKSHRMTIQNIACFLEEQLQASGEVELLKGVPEDDCRHLLSQQRLACPGSSRLGRS